MALCSLSPSCVLFCSLVQFYDYTFLNFFSVKSQNIIVQVSFNALIVCYGTHDCFLHASTGKLDLIL